MLFRMMWHAGRYRIPEILDMTMFDCCLALGVDQRKRPTLPYGAETSEDDGPTIAEKLMIPSRVMEMSPEQMAVIQFDRGA